MLRYLNMFVLIGIALVALSIAGFAMGSRIRLEPGQPFDSKTAFIYLGAGILMLINGYLTIKNPPPVVPKPPKEPATVSE